MPECQRQIVLFDGDCPVCRQLAEFVGRRSAGKLEIQSWQEFQQSRAGFAGSSPASAKLRFYDRGTIHVGAAAWEIMLERYEDLAALSWLAAKLGLTSRVAATLETAGLALRWLCRRCHPR